MTMTAEEVRYPDIYLEASVPAQRRSPDKNERGENETMSSFERYFAEGGRQKPGGSSNGEGPSASTSGATAKLAAQVKELQAKLAERTSELDATKERNKLMEEHIESVGADSEGIVKVNVRVVMYAFLFVILALYAAVGVTFYWEPLGLPAARALVGRWGAACDGTSAASAVPTTQSTGGFFGSWGR